MKKKVLVVENDFEIRDIVSYILEEEGFDCLSIPEPGSMDHIQAFKPDIILVDEFINNKPGHRLCLKIKQVDTLRHIPVIVLSTAHNIEVIAKECKADDYIQKPFDIDEMITKVMRVIDNQSLTFN